MKYVYPALFSKEGDSILVSVPDLPGTHTFGSDIADALFMAEDAVAMWLWDAENNKETIPKASAKSDIEKQCKGKGQFVNLVAADTEEYRRQNDSRAIRKTLSIPAWLNHKAERANAPFSQILQQGLKDYLHITDA
ncbi:MAG: type II toxin-antitoxin system HicB family antitoxin [Oscillospiraceae bacterium]|nr:type II toxin-antitoxin system HicB family antitoxin [Oscillospiraceae bacterium]